MVSNFKNTGCPLAGIAFFNSLDDITKNYADIFMPEEDNENEEYKFEIYNMNHVSTLCLDQEEYARVMKLEFLDEYEEYMLMQGHYFISMAKYIDKSRFENGENDGVTASNLINKFSIKIN